MTVVNELDKTLFESYVKPKADVLTGIVRGGILDTSMDWYETPQPKGQFNTICILNCSLTSDPQRSDPTYSKS